MEPQLCTRKGGSHINHVLEWTYNITYLSKSALSKCCLNTYRQWFGHSDVDGAVAGGLEDVHGIVQAGSLQVSLVNEHESVTGQQAAITVGHTSGHQGPDDQHRLSGVLWILSLDRSHSLDQWFSTGPVSTFYSLSWSCDSNLFHKNAIPLSNHL